MGITAVAQRKIKVRYKTYTKLAERQNFTEKKQTSNTLKIEYLFIVYHTSDTAKNHQYKHGENRVCF